MLVARLDNVGDVVLTGPAVRAVAAGSRRVTFLASTGGAAAAHLLPGVDEVVTFDAPWVAYDAPPADRTQTDALVDRLGGLAIDEALILTSFHQSALPLALLLRLAGIPRIAAASEDYPGSLLDIRFHTVVGHEVEQSLALADTLGYALPADDDGRLALRSPLPATAAFDEPYVVVHPGASVAARGIDADRAASIVDALVADGWRVAVTGSPDERALATAAVGRNRDRAVDLTGAHDLAGLAGVLTSAAALVVGNTGPAHVAAAVGTPVVSVFAPVVSPSRWEPWGVPSRVLGNHDVPCAGCRARTCPLPEQVCLRPVTARAVADAVRALTASATPATSDPESSAVPA